MLRATMGAARTGTVLGYLMIATGVVMAFLGSLLGGVWLAFVGWILTQASRAAYAQTDAEARLAGVRVRELITPAQAVVPPDTTLQEAADDYFRGLRTGCLPVGNGDGSLAGVVCLSDLRHADPDHWSDEAVADAMTPRERVVTLGPEAGAVEALRLMSLRDVNQLVVMDDGHLLGFVERGRLLHQGIGAGAEHDDHDTEDDRPSEAAGPSSERRSDITGPYAPGRTDDRSDTAA